MLKERNKSMGRGQSSKVVAREICSVLSAGTRTYGHLDEVLGPEEAEGGGAGDGRSVLLCVKEKVDDDVDVPVTYGVCLVDTVCGVVTLGQFQDNRQRSRLRTLVAKYMPTEVVLEHLGHSRETEGVLSLLVPRSPQEILRGGEMPSAESAWAIFQEKNYFRRGNGVEGQGEDPWEGVPALYRMIYEGLAVHHSDKAQGAAGGSAVECSDLVMSALGGAMWVLQRALIDFEILSLGRCYAYVPPDMTNDSTASSLGQSARGERDRTGDCPAWSDVTGLPEEGVREGCNCMVLDSITLANLEVFTTTADRSSEKGSLWQFLNRTKTAFGRRLLRDWVSKPLFKPQDIAYR